MTEPVKFVFNERGNKLAAIISIEEYERMLAKLGNVERIRAYEQAKASEDTGVTLEVALARIGRSS